MSRADLAALRVERLGPGDATWLDEFLARDAIWAPQADSSARAADRYRAGSLMLHREDVIILRADRHTVLIARALWSRVFELHVNVDPEARGRPAIRATRACFAWLFANTSCERMFGLPGTHRPEVKRFALACGMKDEGMLPRSLEVGDRMIDRHILAIDREAFDDTR